MAEEFFESEVVFSDEIQSKTEGEKKNHKEEENKNSGCDDQTKKTMKKSIPVSIPEITFSSWGNGYEEVEDEEEMVPPHVILARRIAGKMTFSMCSGNGRTLKGRDLSRVRNSILRLTGFIEV